MDGRLGGIGGSVHGCAGAADGAVDAARFMVGKMPGFYNMESLLEGK